MRMEYTPMGFRKPEHTDFVDIGDLNFNVDLFDDELADLAAEVGAIIPVLDAINGEVI
jgi:hypothetical protein